MFVILLHSSKTMRSGGEARSVGSPTYLDRATELAGYVASLPPAVIAKTMAVSPALAEKTRTLMRDWSPGGGSAAIDTFTGDIYSGFQAAGLTANDRMYAQKTLLILSGLYGVLRPLDPIRPYRLEMAYKFPDAPFDNVYDYWGSRLADVIEPGRTIINTSSAEYTKAVFPYLPADARVITPKFLTVSPKTGEPVFVTVHAKVARGAFARWIITDRIERDANLKKFVALGYAYDAARSTPEEPVFVAREYGGIGLSVRLT